MIHKEFQLLNVALKHPSFIPDFVSLRPGAQRAFSIGTLKSEREVQFSGAIIRYDLYLISY